jgi:hypothetical protein
MSALGHKRTFRLALSMSALPPKADIEATQTNVCFVPKADFGPPSTRMRERYSVLSELPQGRAEVPVKQSRARS